MKKSITIEMIFLMVVYMWIVCTIGCKEKSSPVESENGEDEFIELNINWQLTNGPCGGNVRSVVAGPSGYIFAGCSDNGIFRSADNGDSWKEVNNGLGNLDVLCLCINADGHIFAGTWIGFFRSNDHGENWEEIGNGWNRITAIVINTDGVIFATFHGSGLFRSFDNGDSWEPTDCPSPAPSPLAIDSNNNLFAVYDSIYISQDNGDTWVGVAHLMVNTLAINSSDHIYAAGENGIYLSTNEGATWTFISGHDVSKIAINSTGHLFIATYIGEVFRSTNNGGSWQKLNLDHVSVKFIYINESDNIFLGTWSNGIYRSTDNGGSWMLVGVPASYVTYLSIDSDDCIFAVSNEIARTENSRVTCINICNS